jgi:type III restriction enzyme
VKLQFDAKQQFQLDAVRSVTDLFEGQPENSSVMNPISLGGYEGLFAGQESSELGVGNRLLIDEAALLANARDVQRRNEIEVSDPTAELDAWRLWDAASDAHRACPHFSVEMETGTGKTYVYLRTILELSQRFGFRKFVIVVPSVAIREGVLKNISVTRDHFRALYNNAEFDSFVYGPRHLNRLRHFATANTLQVQVINIQAFVKDFGDDDERRSNVIYKESDRLSGRRPIEFVQAARPIVIIDEPQSVDSTPKSQDAIKKLNPLLTLRYSATHRDQYNLVYRLDPIRAFELKLVKQVVVASAQSDSATAAPFVKLEAVDNRKGITAKLRIRQQGPAGPRDRSVKVRAGQDLHRLSKDRAEYAQGYSVAEISTEPGFESVRFSNGQTLHGLGAEIGGLREELWRAQIKHTVQRHLRNELLLAERGIKVLSLFFIDRVANYRQYTDDGQPVAGKFAEAFEAELSALAADARYAGIPWLQEPFHRLHDGYFAQDRAGTWKDSREGRATQDDESAFHLIMQNKEQLLSIDEPLRFIFSHSALREGWDNPNVFQICTLNETASVVKKRQEIGRGLRLPVDQDGSRVLDESVNKLYVMANESYEDFAKGLQKEYEDDCGVTFGKVPLSALGNLTRIVDDHEESIGPDVAAIVQNALVQQGFLDGEGRIQPAFDPRKPGFEVALPPELSDLSTPVIDLLSAYQIERHFRRERDQKENRLRKQVLLRPEFVELWNQIKHRTTYRVEFDSDELVTSAAVAVRRIPPVRRPKIVVTIGDVQVRRGGVEGIGRGVAEEEVDFSTTPIPDILGYLQNATQLTRSTLLRILRESGRLGDIFNDPQRFMDEAARAINAELHRMLVDGIKYERLDSAGERSEWEMRLFEEQDRALVNALSAIEVTKSVFEYVVYESDTERKFAKRLNDRDDIKLFVKLPNWFKIDTPLGTYNPDWAIVKDDGRLLYLARETKSNLNFLKLRTTEADKVRCGFRHFDAIGVHFDVVNSADQV